MILRFMIRKGHLFASKHLKLTDVSKYFSKSPEPSIWKAIRKSTASRFFFSKVLENIFKTIRFRFIYFKMKNLKLETLQRKDSTADLFQRIHDIFQKVHLLEYLLTFALLPQTILK